MSAFNRVEQKVYNKITANPSKEFSVLDVAKIMFRGKKPPPTWEKSVIARMKTICLKSEVNDSGCKILRCSELGRGKKAKYTCMYKWKLPKHL